MFLVNLAAIISRTILNFDQYRSLSCLGENKRALPDEYCSLGGKQTTRACSIECGEMLSPDMLWSQWSPCSTSCGAGTQTRTIRGAYAKQNRPCYNECDLYQWVLGQWSTCNLFNPKSFCGNGRQNRLVRCVNTNDVRLTTGKSISYGCREKYNNFRSKHKTM